jgi:predicted dienelactone hydrolase
MMVFFDIVTLLSLTLLLFGTFLPKPMKWSWLRSLLLLAALVAVGHLLIEGFRWQMVPTYVVLVAVLALNALATRRRRKNDTGHKSPPLARWSSASFGILLLAATALLSYAFPVFHLPVPDGPYVVGTTEFHLIDTSRPETYAAAEAGYRELMIRVWYPADPNRSTKPTPYWRHAGVRSAAVTDGLPLPWFTFTHLKRVSTNSTWDAPLASDRSSYPVIVYSHGLGIGWASSNTVVSEGLASHGYVVVAIDHAFLGSASIFPDGRVATFDNGTAQAMAMPPPEEVNQLYAELVTSTEWRAQLQIFQQAMSLMPVETKDAVSRALSTQVADQRFVLNEFQRLQATSNTGIPSALDLRRVGFIGQSLGGSAALETCVLDSRCKAGVNLDGFHPRQIELESLNTPFLFLNRENNLLFHANYDHSRAPAYSVRIAGATHFNFFDFSIMSPLYQRLGVLGPIDGYDMLNVIKSYSLAFFDEYLKGEPSDLLGDAQISELGTTIDSRNTQRHAQ